MRLRGLLQVSLSCSLSFSLSLSLTLSLSLFPCIFIRLCHQLTQLRERGEDQERRTVQEEPLEDWKLSLLFGYKGLLMFSPFSAHSYRIWGKNAAGKRSPGLTNFREVYFLECSQIVCGISGSNIIKTGTLFSYVLFLLLKIDIFSITGFASPDFFSLKHIKEIEQQTMPTHISLDSYRLLQLT